MKNLFIYIAIVNHGQDIKVIKYAHEAGVLGATVVHGKGTSNHGLLCFLGLNETRRDIIFIIADKDTGDTAMDNISNGLHMNKTNHGIIFEMPLEKVIGAKKYENQSMILSEVKQMEHQAIFIIVDKGNAELVIDCACQAGARGGTIINARGAGIHETQKIFNIPIEPEKEIVVIVAQQKQVEAITSAVTNELNINDPGKGIIFVMDVTKAIGLYEE